MLKKNVPVAEAEKMVADGARILEHRRDAENQHVCLVEVSEVAESAPAEPESAPAEPESPKQGRRKAARR